MGKAAASASGRRACGHSRGLFVFNVQLRADTDVLLTLMCIGAQLGTSDALESKFKELEGDDVDAELAAMRRGMLGSARSKPALPEGRPIRYGPTQR